MHCAQGRSAAYDHALTMPVIAGKILLVSDLATEFAVSILWTLCRYSENTSVVLQDLQSCLFKKLLVLMQFAKLHVGRKQGKELHNCLGSLTIIDKMSPVNGIYKQYNGFQKSYVLFLERQE